MSGYAEDYLRVPNPFAAISCEIARLACLIHAASVHSEPGSNSPKKLGFKSNFWLLKKIIRFQRTIEKSLLESVRE